MKKKKGIINKAQQLCEVCNARLHTGTNCRTRYLKLRPKIENQVSKNQRCEVKINKVIFSEKQFYLFNELFVEFNDFDEDSSFSKFKDIARCYKPVVYVSQNKAHDFMVIELDSHQRGISDFSFVIYQLESLGKQEYFYLASGLRMHQQQIHMLQNEQIKQLRQQYLNFNYSRYQEFKCNIVPNILSELDLNAYYSYHLVKCVENMSDQTTEQVGFSNKLVQLLFINKEFYSSLILRQGWFDPALFSNRNSSALNFILSMNNYLQINQQNPPKVFNPLQITLITIDGIKIKAQLQPSIEYCLSDNDDPVSPKSKEILGYLYIMKIIIKEQNENQLIQERILNKRTEDFIYQVPFYNQQEFKCAFSQQFQKSTVLSSSDKSNFNDIEISQ